MTHEISHFSYELIDFSSNILLFIELYVVLIEFV